MKKHVRPLIAFLLITLTMLACSSSVSVVETQLPTPIQIDPATEVVPQEALELLPQSLYYLGKDGQGLMQVFRMERDGKTITQLTNELVDVLDYDVSLTDQHLVYEVDNQLILINADGSNRQVLIEGPTRSSPRGYYNPIFSSDGKTLAYSGNGLILFDLATSTSNLVLENKPLGGTLPPESYVPDKFSPDGTKLLLEIAHPPDSPWTAAIYSIATNSLTPITSDKPSFSCCTMYGGAEWSIDGSSLYAIGTILDSSTPFGELWQVDANTGTTTILIPGNASDGNMNLFYLPYKPHHAPDGWLYFFSAKIPEATGFTKRVPLVLIRTKPEDITANWSVLRGETFEMMNEALWAPDGSFVIIANATAGDSYMGGALEMYFTDGSQSKVPLVPFGQQMKWGP